VLFLRGFSREDEEVRWGDRSGYISLRPGRALGSGFRLIKQYISSQNWLSPMVLLALTSLLAVYLAWNLGANDVANSMGTAVGSKAISLRQALVIAGILEFAGAVLLGGNVSQTLATDIIDLSLFSQMPQVLLLGMVAVLLACGLWMNIATLAGLPVSSSHAVVGAIAGFACLAVGPSAVHWAFLGIISATWIMTPVASGAIAALYYSQIKRWILDSPDAPARLMAWIPWLSSLLVGTCGILILPNLVATSGFMALHAVLPLPVTTLELAISATFTLILTVTVWPRPAPADQPTAASAIESTFAVLQVTSACLVAFAHGSNDVGNAIAPLAAIAYMLRTHLVPTEGFVVPLWILVLGGVGIVAGLAVWGKTVILTIGEGITALKPSGGFCAELATATTVLLASQVGLPVSTSHALVGAVVGIGLVQDWRSIQGNTLIAIGSGWLVTIPIASVLSAGWFALGRSLFPNFSLPSL
jgi:inorganic phosphate transporter, PiT family